MFAEKLNFLMDITKSRNSVLANAVSLDASHVSRLRNGGRRLPKNQAFLRPMSEFFARGIKADYQKKVLREALGITGEWPLGEEAAAKIICSWLSEPENPNEASVERILANFASPPHAPHSPAAAEPTPASRRRARLLLRGFPASAKPLYVFLPPCAAPKNPARSFSSATRRCHGSSKTPVMRDSGPHFLHRHSGAATAFA